MKTKELVSNRRAFHEYEIIEKFEAGIVLLGTEIKSIRNHGAILTDSYITIKDNRLYLINASIAPYSFGNVHNHPEKRERMLLMHKREILKLKRTLQEKGLTIVPLSMYLKNNIVKIQIATAKGKKTYDKRSSIRKKEQERMIQRSIKEHKS
jgi:SsrA-binding protein